MSEKHPPPKCGATDLYNAICKGCLVIDARSAPQFELRGACAAAEEGEWESPDDYSIAVIVADEGTSPTAISNLASTIAGLRTSLEDKTAVLPAEELPKLRTRFSWVTSQCALPEQPASWPSAIGPGVFLGSEYHAKPELLTAMGIRTVVCCMDDKGGLSAADASRLGIGVVRFPWVDDLQQGVLADLPAVVRAIHEGKSLGGVFVHCWRGASRSACACAAWLLWADEAFDTVQRVQAHLKAARTSVAINPSFCWQLEQWRRILHSAGGPGCKLDDVAPTASEAKRNG